MNTPRTRREFLGSVGQGMLVASVGFSLASDLGLSRAWGEESDERLSFGPLDPLVALMQETPIDRLLPTLVERLQGGEDLGRLVAAGALANARTFGGHDYVGFHTMMALAPAWHMARELPEAQRPLPVFKVLYRNTNRIHEHGGRSSEVLGTVEPAQAQLHVRARLGDHAEVQLEPGVVEVVAAVDVERAAGAAQEGGGEVVELLRACRPAGGEQEHEGGRPEEGQRASVAHHDPLSPRQTGPRHEGSDPYRQLSRVGR